MGTIRRDKPIFTYLRNMGTQIEMPILAWYIEGQGHRILVDTGGHDPAKGELHPPYMREPGQDPVSRLAALGVRPEDIDILILTHLHWDHASKKIWETSSSPVTTGALWNGLNTGNHPSEKWGTSQDHGRGAELSASLLCPFLSR